MARIPQIPQVIEARLPASPAQVQGVYMCMDLNKTLSGRCKCTRQHHAIRMDLELPIGETSPPHQLIGPVLSELLHLCIHWHNGMGTAQPD